MQISPDHSTGDCPNHSSKVPIKMRGSWWLPPLIGVWHRDSHYWRKIIGGVHKILILSRDLLEELLRNFFGEEIGGEVMGHSGPLMNKRKPTHRLKLGKLEGLIYIHPSRRIVYRFSRFFLGLGRNVLGFPSKIARNT